MLECTCEESECMSNALSRAGTGQCGVHEHGGQLPVSVRGGVFRGGNGWHVRQRQRVCSGPHLQCESACLGAVRCIALHAVAMLAISPSCGHNPSAWARAHVGDGGLSGVCDVHRRRGELRVQLQRRVLQGRQPASFLLVCALAEQSPALTQVFDDALSRVAASAGPTEVCATACVV
eukprot:2983802-Rhodomonas_salina.6